MKRKDLIEKLKSVSVVTEKVEDMQKEYGTEFSQEMKSIISQSIEPLFFEDNSRMLSYGEIFSADIEYDNNFKELGIVPLIECFDNDFIVYNIRTGMYEMYNIIEKIAFNENKTLKDVLS